MTPRDRILTAAADLFYAHGVRATGVDRIIAASGVAKATFYRHFPTKDALVVAFLERRDGEWRAWLQDAVVRLAPAPTDRPLAVFDALAERFRGEEFRGCAFGNTLAELADDNPAAHGAAQRHKRAVTAYLADLLAALPVADRIGLATQLMLLIDGATVTAVREGGSGAAVTARTIAHALIERASTPQSLSQD